MRLDKYLVATGCCTRSVAKKQVRAGAVTINGTVPKSSDADVDPDMDTVTYCGERVVYRKYIYIMLNKPQGYVSATEDAREKTVLDLIPDEVRSRGMFPCGRLDKNTLGLMLLTDNGDLAHRLLSPKHHVQKTYKFTSKIPVTQEQADKLSDGVALEDGYVTKPAIIELIGDGDQGYITLVEGKYHQIKRMLEAIDNKIVYLERITFGPLRLDSSLERGQWRYLSDEEIKMLENQ